MSRGHSQHCPVGKRGEPHSDAARRIFDEYALHIIGAGNNAIGKYFAFALTDGTSDHVLYDTKREAVTHQHHNEQFTGFVRIPPGSITVCECEAWLGVQRMLNEKGVKLTDPDDKHGGLDLINRSTVEDQMSMLRSIRSRGKARPSNLRMRKD